MVDILYQKPDAAQKVMFSIKGFFGKCDHIRSFLKKILNGKLHSLRRVVCFVDIPLNFKQGLKLD